MILLKLNWAGVGNLLFSGKHKFTIIPNASLQNFSNRLTWLIWGSQQGVNKFSKTESATSKLYTRSVHNARSSRVPSTQQRPMNLTNKAPYTPCKWMKHIFKSKPRNQLRWKITCHRGKFCGPGWVSRYTNWLQAEMYVDQIPVAKRL
jgi:hypothetical protein